MYSAPPEQTSPALRQPPAPDAGASWHNPSAAPDAFWHNPPQHSKSLPQMSPACVQNEGAPEQMPALQ